MSDLCLKSRLLRAQLVEFLACGVEGVCATLATKTKITFERVFHASPGLTKRSEVARSIRFIHELLQHPGFELHPLRGCYLSAISSIRGRNPNRRMRRTNQNARLFVIGYREICFDM